MKNNAAFLAEFGYRLSSDFSLGLTVGIPPTTSLYGAGTVEGVGKIGEVKYAPAALTLQYRLAPLLSDRLVPYFGAGVTYLKIFDTTDGAVTNLQARNAWGGVLQAGLEYRITEHIGVFVDVKKFIVRTRATGDLGPVPVHATVRLDPLVTQAGISINF